MSEHFASFDSYTAAWLQSEETWRCHIGVRNVVETPKGIGTSWKAATNIVHLWPVLGLETLALSERL